MGWARASSPETTTSSVAATAPTTATTTTTTYTAAATADPPSRRSSGRTTPDTTTTTGTGTTRTTTKRATVSSQSSPSVRISATGSQPIGTKLILPTGVAEEEEAVRRSKGGRLPSMRAGHKTETGPPTIISQAGIFLQGST